MDSHSKKLFWGCFIALITTGFGFIGRLFLIGEWADEFGLDGGQAGRLAGIGIWPFAVSIIGFSLIIDKVGYKTAMLFAFFGHIVWAVMGVSAYFVSKGGNPDSAYQMIYWGSFILALGNGAVEAFINPVVATMFSKEKTKWLNILHAGWPGGLVIAGMITIFIDTVPWWIKVGMIAIPAVIYLIMLVPCKFPQSERVTAGVSYKEMLGEFGILGSAVVGFLVALQLKDFFTGMPPAVYWGIGIAIVVAFGVYTKKLGNPLMFILIMLMAPLATTEIGTDGWIEEILKGIAGEKGFHAGWVLVYTSLIMMILRFYAGPIVHKFKPLPLLAISAVLAIAGLYCLSITSGFVIFAAATLYAFGKTFFWPTTLGVVAEQTPKGGALTLNAISGIGMLAVGVLGFPYIGKLQEDVANKKLAANAEIAEAIPGLIENGEVTALEDKKLYEIINYKAVSSEKLDGLIAKLPEAKQEEAREVYTGIRERSAQGALANMVIFPFIMLLVYIGLILWFKSKGGYKVVDINASH